MTTFLDGPAKGQVLNLSRAPFFLRVTHKVDGDMDGLFGNWDALDQTFDMPDRGETIYVYQLACPPTRGMIDGTKYRGPICWASYKLVEPQPNVFDTHDTDRWRSWCQEHRAAFDAMNATLNNPEP
jgi:hypothetical protein